MYTTKQSFLDWMQNKLWSKFNFIGIKETEGVSKFFLKGRQIKILKLLYCLHFLPSAYTSYLLYKACNF